MSLESVGVSEVEEQLYRALLVNPDSTLNNLSQTLGHSGRVLRATLESLEGKGLVSRLPNTPARYVPAPPEVAFEVLILRRQEELERVRLEASAMSRQFRSTSHTVDPAEVVEVVIGRRALVQRFMQLQESATGEMLVFDRPPYTGPPDQNRPIEVRLLDRGVACRVVYDQDSLDVPGNLQAIQKMIEVGEQARVMQAVPLKLAIADRRLGFVPLRLDEPGTDSALLVHPSPLLHALTNLFELAWSRAIPVVPTANSTDGHGPVSRLTRDERTLLSLLAAGMKDEAIARQVGIGSSTVTRRLRSIMSVLGARTRFQAGMLAVGRGFISIPRDDPPADHPEGRDP